MAAGFGMIIILVVITLVIKGVAALIDKYRK